MPPDTGRLPAGVRGLALVSLGNDFASEMVYPLLPAFITSTLGGGPVALGALDGAADLTASILRWWSGRRADRPGWRDRLIGLGYAIATVARPLAALAGAAWQVIGVRVVDRIGKGLRSPARDAMIADLTPAALRGRAFGLQRGADHLGAVFGSLAAFGLLQLGWSIRTVLGASAIPGVAALVVVAVVLARSRDGTRPAPQPTREERPAAGGRDRRLVALAGFTAVRLPETLLLLRMQEAGVPVAVIPLLWAGLHVVRSASSYPAGAAADRLGLPRAMGLGTLAYGATIAALALPLGRAAAIAAFLVFGVAAGILEPVERAAVAAVRGARRGSLFGSYQGLAGIGSLVLGVLYGWIYRSAGGGAALALAAAAAPVALGVWLRSERAARSTS